MYAQIILKDKYESDNSNCLWGELSEWSIDRKETIFTVFLFVSFEFVPYVCIIYPKLIKQLTYRAILQVQELVECVCKMQTLVGTL